MNIHSSSHIRAINLILCFQSFQVHSASLADQQQISLNPISVAPNNELNKINYDRNKASAGQISFNGLANMKTFGDFDYSDASEGSRESSETDSHEVLLIMNELKDKEKEFLRRPCPKINCDAKTVRMMFDRLVEDWKERKVESFDNSGLKGFEGNFQTQLLNKDRKGLGLEIYRQNLEIYKLRSDNRLLGLELESLQNEFKLQKIKNHRGRRDDLIEKKSALDNLLQSKSRELERKKILAMELQRELKLIQESHKTLSSYLYEIRKIYGNLNLATASAENAPAIRRNHSK